MIIEKETMMNTDESTVITRDQLTSIHTRLLTMKQQILSQHAESIEQERPSDPLDQAQHEMESLVQLRKRALDTDLLSGVGKALYKIQCGEYGYCEISGEPIDILRLQANPTSCTSIEEQERLERTQTLRQRLTADV